MFGQVRVFPETKNCLIQLDCFYATIETFSVLPIFIHLIKKRLSSELLHCALCIVHCALLHTQTATHHGCNEFLNSIAGAYYETATFGY